jgi:CHAT domain-containing protein/tetratricopeptide (TPR) repeat protein
MTTSAPEPADPAALLSTLAKALAGDRIALMTRHADPDATILDLAKHIDQLMLADLPAAVEGSVALVAIADALGSVLSRLRARRALAQCFSYANRFDEALASLHQAAQLPEAAGQRRELALINITRLHALARLGRLDEAILAGQTARDHLLQCGDPAAAAKADVNLGVVLRMADQPARAIIHFDNARPRFQPPFDDQPMIVAQIESNRAEALLDLHDFENAEAAFHTALALFQQANAHRGAAIVEGNLADLMGRQGRMALALNHFEQARRRLEHEGGEGGGGGAPGDLARLEAESAEVQLQLGMAAEAAAASAAAMERLERQGMAFEAARARMTLGRALAALGQVSAAEAALLHAASQFESASKRQGTAGHLSARASMARAELLCLSGEPEASQRAKSIVMGLLPVFSDRPADAAFAHSLLASIELGASRSDAALEHAAQGLRSARELGLPPLIATLLHLRGRALLQSGRPDDALAALEEAIDQVEHIRGGLQADRFKIAFHAGAAPMYADAVLAVLATGRQDRIERAFSLVERARSRALLDLLDSASGASAFRAALGTEEAEAREPVEAELIDELDRAGGRLNALYTRLHEFGSAAPSRDGLRRARSLQTEIAGVQQRIVHLESRLASVSMATVGGAGGRGVGELFAGPISLAATRRQLSDRAALLEYFIAGGDIVVFVVTAEGEPIVRRLCSVEETAATLERMRFQVARALARGSTAPRPGVGRGAADMHTELEDLCTALLAPIVADLPGITRLIIAPYGLLHGVPFHALRDRAGGEFVLERYEVLNVPSASVLARIGVQRPEAGALPPLIVGVADEKAPGIADEVDALEAILPGARVMRQEEATISAVVAQCREAPLVHFATHGIFSGSSPGASGLRLADGWLTAREICRIDLRGAVVALSGCETGRSGGTGGDEQQGLVRSFLIAGARAVLGTSWPVHDRTATELLVSAYRLWYVEGGGRPRGDLAAALRAVQIEFARRGIHPAYWSPFFLVGTP